MGGAESCRSWLAGEADAAEIAHLSTLPGWIWAPSRIRCFPFALRLADGPDGAW